jgi:hypothetical protein
MVVYYDKVWGCGRQGDVPRREETRSGTWEIGKKCVCPRLYYTASLSLVSVAQVMACR